MIDCGSIVLVPFPFTDLTSSKVRPALVVNRKRKNTNDVIVCFITSRIERGIPNTVLLPSNKETGLKVPSLVRLDKIATLDRRIILGALGKVSLRELKECGKVFRGVFGF